MLLQHELQHNSGAATYGRKLDLQCRSDDPELENSEFKVSGASLEQNEAQYQKNLRVNQAMMLYLREQDGYLSLEDMEILALDVHEALDALLVNMEYLVDMTEKVDEQSILHEQQRCTEDHDIPDREPRGLGNFTFFSPSKKPCPAQHPQEIFGDSYLHPFQIPSSPGLQHMENSDRGF
ncbi:hypothetical protein BGW38_004754 [Lunasporangiospora selenospora]|uniref:Uncharacterized protein n=1 Tax=Lunasporangiospora selenospora TaxID=979761 RepID=A0A9P6FPQ6_9FUNG|nr:hypothetical protein BGW38_004754 [Lunasporangiospora selenospora]